MALVLLLTLIILKLSHKSNKTPSHPNEVMLNVIIIELSSKYRGYTKQENDLNLQLGLNIGVPYNNLYNIYNFKYQSKILFNSCQII